MALTVFYVPYSLNIGHATPLWNGVNVHAMPIFEEDGVHPKPVLETLTLSLSPPPSPSRSLATRKEHAPAAFMRRSRANMAHIRQSRPDRGLDLKVKVVKPLSVVPS